MKTFPAAKAGAALRPTDAKGPFHGIILCSKLAPTSFSVSGMLNPARTQRRPQGARSGQSCRSHHRQGTTGLRICRSSLHSLFTPGEEKVTRGQVLTYSENIQWRFQSPTFQTARRGPQASTVSDMPGFLGFLPAGRQIAGGFFGAQERTCDATQYLGQTRRWQHERRSRHRLLLQQGSCR